MSNRLIDLDHYAQRLNTLKEAANKAVDDFVRTPDNLDTPLPLVYGINTSIFLSMVDNGSQQLHQATNFETDVIKILNRKAGTTDRLFAFPLSPFSETDFAGMKMAFIRMAESL